MIQQWCKPITTIVIYLYISTSNMFRSITAFQLNRHYRKSFVQMPSFSSISQYSYDTNTKSQISRRFLSSTIEHTQNNMKLNLHTMPLEELIILLQSWNQPAYRAKQIQHWVREKGVSSISEMNNLPKNLKVLLEEYTTLTSTNLSLAMEQISNDGTIKRAYQLHDGQIIESVLMPYENKNGRNTACISSQAGCAMGCVFCATGQMGFARQLTSDEIFEQVSRFASELKSKGERLSNVVMMGMGEPLANYRNVMEAIHRMNTELGIGARKITVSTVGVVPNIRKLIDEPLQIRLAISLHCATEEERTQLLPANRRYGGLDELMLTVKQYTETTKRRVTFEWALIENQNDTPEVARQLGNLLKRFDFRMDLVHINLIPLNPTGGFEQGRPSGKNRVDQFVHILESEYGVSATPRMRRGIDIDAGCGQLKSKVKKKEKQITDVNNEEHDTNHLDDFINVNSYPSVVGVYEDDDYDDDEVDNLQMKQPYIHKHSIDLDSLDEDFEDEEFQTQEEFQEADRLLSLVQNSFPAPLMDESNTVTNAPVTTSITNEESIKEAKKRRKKLLKNLKMIKKLLEREKNEGLTLNEEQRIKVSKEQQWKSELESVEHNLQ